MNSPESSSFYWWCGRAVWFRK